MCYSSGLLGLSFPGNWSDLAQFYSLQSNVVLQQSNQSISFKVSAFGLDREIKLIDLYFPGPLCLLYLSPLNSTTTFGSQSP